MKSADWYIFKDFIDLADGAKQKKLLSFLANEERNELSSIPSLPMHPSRGLSSYAKRLEDIHYSWFTPLLEKMFDQDKYLFISVLGNEQKEKLYKYFDMTKEVGPLSSFANEFISSKLYHHFIGKYNHLLPKECLPEDPLNSLLDLSRESLLSLVDLLSMHDLSLELKTLINASHMQKIEILLSGEQKEYLIELRKTIEPVSFKPIGLNHWNGDEKILKKILHQRGLNRLSKAISFSHISLLWHLSHKLDMGRASIVKTLFKELKNKKAHKVLVSQVCELLNAE